MGYLASKLEPFDHTEPYEIMADHFRREVAKMAILANKITVYRDLETGQKVECLMAGVVTGLLGICFAHVTPESYGAVCDAVAAYVPHARENAEAMISKAKRT